MLTSTLGSLALLVVVLAPGVLPAPTKKYPTNKYKSTKGHLRCSGKQCPDQDVTTGLGSPATLPPPEFQPSNPWVPPSPVVISPPLPPSPPPPQFHPPNPWFRPGQENITITFGKPQRPPFLGKEGAKKENAPTTPVCPGTKEKCEPKGHKCYKHKWHSDDDDDDDDSDSGSDSDSDDDSDDEDHHWFVPQPSAWCNALACPRKEMADTPKASQLEGLR